MFKANNDEVVKDEIDRTVVDLSKFKKSKNTKFKNEINIRAMGFLISKAKIAFI